MIIRHRRTNSLEIETNTDDAPEETEHLKAQIEETRAQMGETIDAIQEKLSFSEYIRQVRTGFGTNQQRGRNGKRHRLRRDMEIRKGRKIYEKR